MISRTRFFCDLRSCASIFYEMNHVRARELLSNFGIYLWPAQVCDGRRDGERFASGADPEQMRCRALVLARMSG